MAEAAANSRGDGKSPKPVISDHCHRSECKAALSGCRKPQNKYKVQTEQEKVILEI